MSWGPAKADKWVALFVVFGCLGLVLSCVDEPGRTPGTLTDCDACHGEDGNSAPPASVGGNTATTFTGVGAHRSHTDASTWHATVACDECHVVPTLPLDAGHIDTELPAEVTFGTLSQTAGATPAWNGAVCFGSYCHGETLTGGTNTTPAWTTVDGTQAVCGACHGLPPDSPHISSNLCGECHAAVADNTLAIVDGTLHINGTVTYDISGAACALCHTTPATGSHSTHVDTQGYACTKCHDGYPANANHYNGTNESGVGAGLVTFDAFNPAPAAHDEATGTCSDTWCHGPSSRDVDPVWGATTIACGNCHTKPMDGTLTTGGVVHTANPDCNACHSDVVNPGNATFADPSRHLDGIVDVSAGACNSCHGGGTNDAPPVDTGGGSSTAATGVGAHQSHLSPDQSAAVACTECHVVPAAESDPGHTDTSLPAEVTFGALADADGVTSTWTDPTCSTYCHGASLNGGSGTAPVWTTVDGTQDECGDCHGLPPGGTHVNSPQCGNCHAPVADSTPAITTAGQHVDGAVDSPTACDACHGSATNAAPPTDLDGTPVGRGVGAHQAHLTSMALRDPVVACTECHTVPAARDDAGHIDSNMPAEVDFAASAMGSGTVWTAATTTCSSTYCHGDTLNGGSATSPDWTVTDGSQKQCDSCHGSPPGGTHVADNQCGDCHSQVADNAPSIIDATLHIDGTVQTDALSCNACHGSGANDAPPVDTSGNSPTTFIGVGAHQAHLAPDRSAVVACTECHVVPAAVGDAGHMDGTMPAEVTFGVLANADGASPAWDGAACSTSYCHGGTLDGGSLTTPIWTTVDGTQDVCGTCHGLPPGTPHPFSNQCGDCHAAVADSTPAITNAALHINGTVEYDIAAAPCDACHGGGGNSAPPVDVIGNAATTFTGVGAHREHTDSSAWHATVACTECHVVPASPTDAGHLDGTMPAEITFGALANADGASPNWNGTICATSYCHGGTLDGGSLTTPTWTTVDGTQDACGTCHGLPPNPPHSTSSQCGVCHAAVADNTPQIVDGTLHLNGSVQYDISGAACALCHTTPVTGSHTAHAVTLGYACTRCHDGYPSSPNHCNGSSETTGLIAFDAGNSGGTYNEGASSCGSLWCHGPNSVSADPVWGGAAPTCGQCHPNPPTVGSHVVHTGNDFSNPAAPEYDFACGECHNGVNTAVPHVDFGVDVALDSGAAALATGYGANGGNTPTWNAGPRTCSDVYCHSNGVTKEKGGAYDLGDIGTLGGSAKAGTLAYNTPAWGGTVPCGDCHAGASLGTTLLSSHYPTTGEHQKGQHSTGSKNRAAGYTPCSTCHSTALGDARQGTYGTAEHVDGALKFHPYDVLSGGTMQNPEGTVDSYQDGHCGGGKSCWY